MYYAKKHEKAYKKKVSNKAEKASHFPFLGTG